MQFQADTHDMVWMGMECMNCEIKQTSSKMPIGCKVKKSLMNFYLSFYPSGFRVLIELMPGINLHCKHSVTQSTKAMANQNEH